VKAQYRGLARQWLEMAKQAIKFQGGINGCSDYFDAKIRWSSA
jgi:hypothetical protein